MQAIVETLTGLNGVRHVGIYKNGEIISTNFTDDLSKTTTRMSKNAW